MRAINLIPPEAAVRSRQLRRRFGYVLAGLAYLALLVLITFWWQAKADAVRQDVEAQVEINNGFELRIAQLAQAEDLRRRYQTGVERIETILVADVAWGRLLNDLGRVIPDRTWLASFTGSSGHDDSATDVYGTLQISGTAFDYPDAATWVRTLNSERWPAVAAGWLDGSSRTEIFDGVPVVSFSSTALLTGDALSSRAETRIPTVPE